MGSGSGSGTKPGLSLLSRRRPHETLIVVLTCSPRPPRRPSWLLRHAVPLLTVAAAALVPWLVVLAVTLPSTVVARRWDVAWVGLDCALALGLGVTAWLWRRSDRRAGLVAVATATLTCVDAWFDVCTSPTSSEMAAALAMAVLVELPLAVFCMALATNSSRTAQ